MNILIPDSWLREYLDTKATPVQLKEYLSLCGPTIERINKIGNDPVYDIEITTNRVDMASVYGIAREAAAILPRFGIKTKLKNLPEVDTPRGWHRPKDTSDGGRQAKARHDSSDLPAGEAGVEDSVKLPMNISDPEFICNRIMSIVLETDPMKPSPDYVKDRLEKSGVRSLNNLVDITNYVMLEVGHPCHVFDYDRIKTHQFIIRFAKKNEPIITLDNKKYLLNENDVIIDDGTGRVIDLPGIMGTENSVVTKDTGRIIFFIESNNPTLIRKTSMRYGIRTMAATINEKHPDPELVKIALFRGIDLYRKLAGAKIAGELVDIYPHPSKPESITVSVDFINERLGIKLSENEIINILKSLSFKIDSYNLQPTTYNLKFTPPTFRQFDVTIPEDIVEEIARIYGYHNLPSQLINEEIPLPKDTPRVARPAHRSRSEGGRDSLGVEKSKQTLTLEYKIKTILKYWGHTETYHYSFISGKLIEKAGLKEKDHLKVTNPLTEETEYMRTNLIPSMLETIAKNQHHKDHLSLFELAKVYLPQRALKTPGWPQDPFQVEGTGNDLPHEVSMLIIANQDGFYHLKGIVEGLFEELGIHEVILKNVIPNLFRDPETLKQVHGDSKLSVRSDNSTQFFHPLQSLQLTKSGQLLAIIGKLHPSFSTGFGIKKDTYIAYLNVENLVSLYNPLKKFSPLPQFPPLIEDITIEILPKTQIGPIIDEIYLTSDLVKKTQVVDRYHNSLTLRLTYQSNKENLTLDRVHINQEKILSSLIQKFRVRHKN